MKCESESNCLWITKMYATQKSNLAHRSALLRLDLCCCCCHCYYEAALTHKTSKYFATFRQCRLNRQYTVSFSFFLFFSHKLLRKHTRTHRARHLCLCHTPWERPPSNLGAQMTSLEAWEDAKDSPWEPAQKDRHSIKLSNEKHVSRVHTRLPLTYGKKQCEVHFVPRIDSYLSFED